MSRAAENSISVRTSSTKTSLPRTIGRIALGAFLLFAGISHLTWSRAEFLAQVPSWVPLDRDAVVLLSGVAEVGLGGALVALPGRRITVGWLVAVFFVAVFPGNIAQFVTRTDAFGLDSDRARGIRLLFQPLLVVWALWSAGVLHRRRR
ncbi:DoxX family protein [Cryobacterium zhongshanensis]|uniref:DoxX family membrane protein n=1 Tax=Cryobacterium zhongshanensis TaxID=2928153 RepID=A0AA41QV28_9MICO|nr:hypothetical protein [Cryobacterium zhongshanensis]MCI4657552.1 hypothetical protein [Cryobacterium zhongshanensis]